MAYSVLEPGAIAAQNIDSLNKIAKYTAGAVENGNVVKLTTLSTASGENEVFLAATPATATLATDIFYMVSEPVSVLTDSKYRGLNDDPTLFNIAASTIFGVFKPKVGDEIKITEDGLAGTKSSNTYVIPADNALELTWASSISAVSLAWELIETTYVEIPAATFYDRRTVAYKFRCVKAD